MSEELRKYYSHEQIVRRFPDGYSVKMGFGLHIGWAIEGAIGSVQKVDASYLSPHVNMSARLEAATKQYGVPILMSGPFFDMLSPAAKKYCRLIDRVTVKGSKTPIELYTFDAKTIVPGFLNSIIVPPAKSERRPTIHLDFSTNMEIAALQQGIPPGFNTVFREGVEAYLTGDWGKARDCLIQAESLLPDDGPSKTLLSYMEEFEFNSPHDWDGYRELTEKW